MAYLFTLFWLCILYVGHTQYYTVLLLLLPTLLMLLFYFSLCGLLPKLLAASIFHVHSYLQNTSIAFDSIDDTNTLHVAVDLD